MADLSIFYFSIFYTVVIKDCFLTDNILAKFSFKKLYSKIFTRQLTV